MATKLKNMKLTSVDLVRAGANQEADIGLFKSAGPQAVYDEALVKSARSILEDPDLAEDQRAGMLAKSVDDYRAALEEPEEDEPEGEEVMVEKEPEEEDLADLDEIEEVEKSSFTSEDRYDMIETVQKFNPFHDALGRFASANSFRTYSANPKSKAGAMAIGRSARAGHTSTMNVHTESKGENVGQNYTWLQTGQKPAFLTGGAGAQKTPPPPPVPKPKRTRKPKAQQPAQQSIEDAVAQVKLTSSDKLALQARDEYKRPCETQKIAEPYNGTRIAGQDVSKTFDARKDKSGGAAIDAVARAQGWDKAAPTVISDRETFDKLCLQNGRVMMRTVHEHANGTSAADIAAATMTKSDITLGGTGATARGGGLYVVDTRLDPKQSGRALASSISVAQQHSFGYADSDDGYKQGVQMMATLRPGAKIATYQQSQALSQEFHALPRSERRRFSDSQNGTDIGAYIASKGYDGAEWDVPSDPTRYTTIYNKSALVFFSEAALRSDMTS